MSLFEPIFSFVGTEAAQYALTGQATARSGSQSTHTAPRNIYACSDGRHIALSGSMQAMAERIFRAIGRPDLVDDPRFRTNRDRVTNRDALDALIEGFIAERTQAENLRLFEATQVTVGPVGSVPELLDHPYTAGREVIVSMADDDVGELPMHNVVPRLSRIPGVMRRPPPGVGEHTAEVLAEIGLAAGKARDSIAG